MLGRGDELRKDEGHALLKACDGIRRIIQRRWIDSYSEGNWGRGIGPGWVCCLL